jgi:hypothetical protein
MTTKFANERGYEAVNRQCVPNFEPYFKEVLDEKKRTDFNKEKFSLYSGSMTSCKNKELKSNLQMETQTKKPKYPVGSRA